MFKDMTPFFDENNGTDIAAGVIDGVTHNGYLNGVEAEFYLDNSGPAVERYTFDIEYFAGWRSVVGKTIVVNGENHLIDGIDNDGTGVLTLQLFAQ